MPFSGQLWYITEGGDANTRLVRINDDGTGSTVVIDNGGAGTGDDKLPSSFTSDIGLDTAAGTGATPVGGVHARPAAATTRRPSPGR